MGPGIELKQVSLTIDGIEILPKVSAYFSPGKLHAITGVNGSGKSSLLKAILGLMSHQGTIKRHWQGGVGQIAYVPQQTAFEPSLPVTVGEFLLSSLTQKPFFLRRRSDDLKQVNDLLSRVGMQDKGKLRLGELSGGERQRLLFAQALERDSLFWCLDEPMTGLDQQAQILINCELKRLRSRGATLLVIHHDRSWIEEYADHIWQVSNGLFVEGEL